MSDFTEKITGWQYVQSVNPFFLSSKLSKNRESNGKPDKNSLPSFPFAHAFVTIFQSKFHYLLPKLRISRASWSIPHWTYARYFLIGNRHDLNLANITDRRVGRNERGGERVDVSLVTRNYHKINWRLIATFLSSSWRRSSKMKKGVSEIIERWNSSSIVSMRICGLERY